MAKKIIALFIFYAFTFSIVGPIDMAIVSTIGGDHAGHGSVSHGAGHYCVVFKGPCKHGDSCPKKHLHRLTKRPTKVSDAYSSKNQNHNKHNSHDSHGSHENNNGNYKDTLVIGASCHNSDSNNSSKVVIDRFLVSLEEEFYNFSILASIVPDDGAIYTSHIMDAPDRPPAV